MAEGSAIKPQRRGRPLRNAEKNLTTKRPGRGARVEAGRAYNPADGTVGATPGSRI